jgi:GNAT superfamily N-acetyltransferase
MLRDLVHQLDQRIILRHENTLPASGVMMCGVSALNVRDATLADMSSLQEIFERASLSNEGDRPALLEHPEVLVYSDEWVRRGDTRVAVRDGRVVGFATAVVNGATCELEDLFVDPDFMRQGVARDLIGDAVTRARAANVPRIDVTGNGHALDFYYAVGFVRDGDAKVRFGLAHRLHLDVADGDA